MIELLTILGIGLALGIAADYVARKPEAQAENPPHKIVTVKEISGEYRSDSAIGRRFLVTVPREFTPVDFADELPFQYGGIMDAYSDYVCRDVIYRLDYTTETEAVWEVRYEFSLKPLFIADSLATRLMTLNEARAANDLPPLEAT
jgi:hypothetical protein